MKICDGKIDLVVVLDSSGSIRPEEFERVKIFVSQFTSEFKIESDQTQLGVITFSNRAHVDIKLGELNTVNEFQRGVAQIPFRPGLTNTAAAISSAQEQFIINGRQGVSHVLLVITDGRSNSRAATLQAAANARTHDIEIYVIGIGVNIDGDELNAIASEPDTLHVNLLSDFSQSSFRTLLKPLARNVCGECSQVLIDLR